MYRGFSLLPEILDRISFLRNITEENTMHTDSMRQEIWYPKIVDNLLGFLRRIPK